MPRRRSEAIPSYLTTGCGFLPWNTGERLRRRAQPVPTPPPSSGISGLPATNDHHVPAELDVHLIVDNYATHKHPRVKRWLATRPRFHVHFTPTYIAWLNQVEIWFNLITRRAIRRGTFRSVKHLVATIDLFVLRYNAKARPFIWTATADSILEKLRRLCERISGTQH